MSSASTPSITKQMKLKLMVDTLNKRVLFAEAGKDFVDFLFNISYLPHGTVMKLLAKGCLGNIYKSIEDHGDRIMLPLRKKDDILMPKVVTIGRSNVDPQSLSMLQTSTSTFKLCECNTLNEDISMRVHCNSCAHGFNHSTYLGEQVGYVKDNETYTVMDDLLVRPKANVCFFTLLKSYDIKNIETVDARDVFLGEK